MGCPPAQEKHPSIPSKNPNPLCRLRDPRGLQERKSMRTLLIYPQYPDTFWSFKHALKFIHRKAALPPLGLLTMGKMLPDEWPKKLIDLNVTKLEGP
jgi:hypothetical protein